jgi:hypothetical protein
LRVSILEVYEPWSLLLPFAAIHVRGWVPLIATAPDTLGSVDA